MALDYPGLLAELRSESDLLIAHLERMTDDDWGRATASAGWIVQDQVSHLAFFDDATRSALTDPDGFRPMADALIAGGMDFPDRIADEHRRMAPEELLAWFRTARRDLLSTLDSDEPKRRVPWFGPDMSVASAATARLMETWAHGHDIYEALGVAHPGGPALRSIAHLGVSTFAFSHRLHGVPVPDEPVRVELRAPDGRDWTWGPEDAADRIVGTAEDFVLTVTQRRHWSETGLAVQGTVATGWMEVAQAFAGAASKREARVEQR